MHWQRDILWNDQIEIDEPFEAYVVHHAAPRHPRFPEDIHLLVVQRPQAEDAAILQASLFDTHGFQLGLTFAAAFSAPMVTFNDLVIQFGFNDHCRMRDCTFHSGTVFLHSDSLGHMPLRRGRCVQCHLDPLEGPNERERDEVYDDNVMMQTFEHDPLGQDMLRMNQLMPNWEVMIPEGNVDPNDQHDGNAQEGYESEDHDDDVDLDNLLQTDSEQEQHDPTYLYRKTHGSRVTILHETEYDNMLLEVAHVWNRAPDDVYALHETAVLPERVPTHARCYITEMRQDKLQAPFDKLILVDVEFCYSDPARSMRYDRRVRLAPARMTRFRLLFICHLSHHCLLEHERCIVFHNGNIWKLQDLTLHRIDDGDYVRIVVPPSDEHEETSAIAWRRQKRINPALVTDDEIGSCSEDEAEEDEHAMFQTECKHYEPVRQRSEGEDDDPTASYLAPLDEEPAPFIPFEVPHEDVVRDELYQLWDTHGATEDEDEGKVLYVHTWFLNHELHPECWRSRTVRLCPNPMLWFMQMAHEWRDLCNPACSSMGHCYVSSHHLATTETAQTNIRAYFRDGQLAGLSCMAKSCPSHWRPLRQDCHSADVTSTGQMFPWIVQHPARCPSWCQWDHRWQTRDAKAWIWLSCAPQRSNGSQCPRSMGQSWTTWRRRRTLTASTPRLS